MKDCERLIIVYYVNVSKYATHKVPEVLAGIKGVLDANFDETIKSIVVPIYENETHIEFCRPEQSIYNEIYESELKKLDELI